MLYEEIRFDIGWDDPTITGQQFLDRTRGFVTLLAEHLPQFPHQAVFNWPEERMDVLAADLSDFDDVVVACLRETSFCRGHQEFTRDGIPYMEFKAYLTFGPDHKSWVFKLRHELSNQLGGNVVSLDFAPGYQTEDLVIPLFYLTLNYWRPENGGCGMFSMLRELNPDPLTAKFRPIMGMIFEKDPAFTQDLPEFVKVTPMAGGYVLQVLDDAPFADSPEGRAKIKQLHAILGARGLLDIPKSE
ncbi:MAG: hypothetical protein AAF732_12265 [Pseudomonadota bacterium]